MTMTLEQISPRELEERRQRGEPIDLIDVRTPAEFREAHVEYARNAPLESLDPEAVIQSRAAPSRPLYVMCRSGGRSRKACDKFLAKGLHQVVDVAGGLQAWEEAQLPLKRGKKAISLERQVRIAAGSLVLLGVGLSFLHIAFLAIAAFVGAGLVFAGVTDTCGMGMLLARMPWNQVSEPTPAPGEQDSQQQKPSCCA